MLNNSDGKHKRPQLPSIVATEAYCDTLQLRLYSPLRSLQKRKLDDLLATGHLGSYTCFTPRRWQREQPRRDRVLRLNQVSQRALQVLEFGLGTGYHINEIHLALELITDTESDAGKVQRYINQHLCMPWHRGRKVADYDGTFYISPIKTPRILLTYADRASKITGEASCKVENRLKGKGRCAKSGFSRMGDLIQLDHLVYWQRALWLWEVDRKKFERKIRRQAKLRVTGRDHDGVKLEKMVRRLTSAAFLWYVHKVPDTISAGYNLEMVNAQIWRDNMPDYRNCMRQIKLRELYS